MSETGLFKRIARRVRSVEPSGASLPVPADGSSVTWLSDTAERFAPTLAAAKARRTDVDWYPYGSLENFRLFKTYFGGEARQVFDGLHQGMRIVDIGAADGDTSFTFASLGAKVTVIDNGPTNFNGCRGLKALNEELEAGVTLIEQDIDSEPAIPGQYDLAVFLGILYHLKNPMLALTSLANAADRMLLSTVTFSRLPDGTPVEDVPLGYFWDATERNNDPTNYWAFTPAGLRRLLARSGWRVVDEFRVGEVPADPVIRDERMFCYCRRV
jgi:hypothetical protein